jgi:hypothetical protein
MTETGFLMLESRMVEVKGVTLPWVRLNGYYDLYPDRYPEGPVAESGEVFIPLGTLLELSEQGVYDSQFGSAFLLGLHEGLALEAAGLAFRETRGGYHGTPELKALLEAWGV